MERRLDMSSKFQYSLIQQKKHRIKTSNIPWVPDPFGIILFIEYKICAPSFEEINNLQVKIEVPARPYNRTLGIFSALTDTPTMGDQTYPKLSKVVKFDDFTNLVIYQSKIAVDNF